MESFLNQLKIDGLSENTLITYRSELRQANNFKPLDSLTKQDVTTYITFIQDKLKPASFEHRKLTLKKFFKWQGKDIADHIKAKIKKRR